MKYQFQLLFENIVKFFGYKDRGGNYYVFSEKDGYINVSRKFPNQIIYSFFKNYYFDNYNTYHNSTNYKKSQILFGYECITTNKTLEARFNNIDEFTNFLCRYHVQKGRKYKLQKLQNKHEK